MHEAGRGFSAGFAHCRQDASSMGTSTPPRGAGPASPHCIFAFPSLPMSGGTGKVVLEQAEAHWAGAASST